MARLEVFRKKLSCIEGNIIVILRWYYCPSEVILLSIGGTFFVPEMLLEATKNFFKKMKVIGQYGIQWAIFQQILVDQGYVSLKVEIED